MSYETYPLDLPTNVGIIGSGWKLKRAVAVSASPFSGVQQSQEYDLALWQATISLPPMKRADAAYWQAFFLKLHGRSGSFLMGDPDAKQPRGTLSGGGSLVTSVSVAMFAHEVPVTCVGRSNQTILKVGDYVQFGAGASAKLHMVVADATTDGSGQTTLIVEPPLKAVVSISESVIFSNPRGVFRMDTSELGWDSDHVSRFGVSFSCTEKL